MGQVHSRTVTISRFGQFREHAYAFAWSIINRGFYAQVTRQNGEYSVEYYIPIH